MDPTTRAILAAMLTAPSPMLCACGRYAEHEGRLFARARADPMVADAYACDNCLDAIDRGAYGKMAWTTSPAIDKARLYNAFLDDCERVASQAGGGVPAMGDSAWAQLGGGRR